VEIEKVLVFLKECFQQKEDAVLAAQSSLVGSKSSPKHRSEYINELSSALAKAQAEMPTAGLRSENPYFKSSYADLAEIVRVSRPHLTKNGLSVTQQILTNEDGGTILHTVMMHASGQWIETCMRVIPPKNDIQTLGSYITYLRRYSYAALVGVVAADEDDDGEKAQAVHRETFAKGVAVNTKYNPREESNEVVSRDQIDELEYELAEYPDICEMILDGLKIQSLADMPKTKYSASIRRVREIKQARNGK
jgi:hypothetical protein